MVKISKGGGLWIFFASSALQNPIRMPNMWTELKSLAQEKLPPKEIMKNITDPAKSGEKYDKNFCMFIEKKLSTNWARSVILTPPFMVSEVKPLAGEESRLLNRIKLRFFTPFRSVQNEKMGVPDHPVKLFSIRSIRLTR